METERAVQASIDKLRAGKTTIIIAHRLSTIINADSIFVLDKGISNSQGIHQQLLEGQSTYSSLFLDL